MQEFQGSWSNPSLLFVNVQWCGYCRDAKPTMEKTADILGTVVPVVSIDADKHEAVAKQLGVKSFPTIIFVDGSGAMHKFGEQERSVNTIVSFVCSKAAVTGQYKFCTKIF